jgi:hypothetical protein
VAVVEECAKLVPVEAWMRYPDDGSRPKGVNESYERHSPNRDERPVFRQQVELEPQEGADAGSEGL